MKHPECGGPKASHIHEYICYGLSLSALGLLIAERSYPCWVCQGKKRVWCQMGPKSRQGLTRWTALTWMKVLCESGMSQSLQKGIISSQKSQKVTALYLFLFPSFSISPLPSVCLSVSVRVSLCSFRYFWRRHPQLRTVDLNFISLFWPFLPNGLQAAYEDFDRDLVVLFKGNILPSPHSALPEGQGRASLGPTALSEGTGQEECAASQAWAHHSHQQLGGFAQARPSFRS